MRYKRIPNEMYLAASSGVCLKQFMKLQIKKTNKNQQQQQNENPC